MRQAVLSDIHSNLEALERCLAHARTQGVERYVCLGDVVGYGADPAAVAERLFVLPGLLLVRGNHDEALLRDVDEALWPGVAESLAWTRAQLSAAELERLASAPYLCREGTATFVHASAHRPEAWEYIWSPEQARACMQAAGTPLTFIGHVHVPMVFYETPGGALRALSPPPGVAIPLSPRARYVINVGSVGQPRDGISAASYVIYDDNAGEVTFHRVAYDHASAAAKIRAAGLDPFFAERLAYGR